MAGPGESAYGDPVRLFADTYPTRGLKNVLANVRRRLRGRNLELIEHRVLRRLSQSGIKLGRVMDAEAMGDAITEDLALTLGLLFGTLAPMRNRDNMRAVTEGIEATEREEMTYWLGMATHRQQPRRVLTALRILLTAPGTRGLARKP